MNCHFCLFVLFSCTLFACQTENSEHVTTVSNNSDRISHTDSLPHLLDTLLNSNDYLVLGKLPAQVKVINQDELEEYSDFEVLIGYKEDLVIGKIATYEELDIYRKYTPESSFEDFPAPVYNGKLAEPDFSSNPDAKRFITRIKKECDQGINFAGYFTLVTWGCGFSMSKWSDCRSKNW